MPDAYPFSEIDKQIDALRPGLSGGEMAQLIAMKEIDRLLDIRRQLAELAITTTSGLSNTDTLLPTTHTG